jgi:hypothetical protein
LKNSEAVLGGKSISAMFISFGLSPGVVNIEIS